jgi:hypothetical protein
MKLAKGDTNQETWCYVAIIERFVYAAALACLDKTV